VRQVQDVYIAPRYILEPPAEAHFADTFNFDPNWEERWIRIVDGDKYQGACWAA
jgi:hypothetical protein